MALPPTVAAVVLFLSFAYHAAAQCFQLTKSATCPGFATQFINPANLSNAWPFFADVDDVTTFDTQFALYLTNEDEFRQTKYIRELGCSNDTTSFTLQYEQTFLCSEFTQISYTAGCYANSGVARKMACQSTCLQFAASENTLVADPVACGPTNLVGDARQGNLTKDFTTCTDWTTLTSNNTATCVLGQSNEPNCGFRTSIDQLCSFCNPANGRVDSCCGANVDLSSCKYKLAASQILPTPTATTSLPSSTNAAGTTAPTSGMTMEMANATSGLSGGAKAGIAIAVIVAALVLAVLALCLLRRRRSAHRYQKNSPAESHLWFLPGRHTPHGSGDSSSSPSMLSPNMMEKGSTKASSDRKGSDDRSTEAKVLLGATGLATGAGVSAAAAAPPPVGSVADKDRPLSGGTATTASSNEGRNLVSSYRDQYSTIDIAPGTEVIAIYAYNPNLPDELRLEPEMVVRVRKIFDDGWAVGSVVSNGPTQPEGAFPLVVCTAASADAADQLSSSDSGYSRSELHRRSSGNSNMSGNSRSSSIAPSRSDSFNSVASRPRAPSSDGGGLDPTLRVPRR